MLSVITHIANDATSGNYVNINSDTFIGSIANIGTNLSSSIRIGNTTNIGSITNIGLLFNGCIIISIGSVTNIGTNMCIIAELCDTHQYG